MGDFKKRARGDIARGLLRLNALHLAALVLMTALAYSNTIGSPFVWDDGMFIRDNPIVRNIDFFAAPTDASAYPQYNAFIHRYLGFLTFALNYKFGALSPAGYHLLNLAIHIINVLLVYRLILLTFRAPRMRGSALAPDVHFVALLAATLFALHPVQTEAVTYIFQRCSSLCALFSLGSLSCYVGWRLGGGRWKLAASVLACVAAMLTKEIAFIVPAAVLVYELVFFDGPAHGRLWALIPHAMTLPIVPVLHARHASTLTGVLQNTWHLARDILSLNRTEYFYTQQHVLVKYLQLMLLPVGQNIDHDIRVHTLCDPCVIGSMVLLSVVFALGLLCIHRARSGKADAALNLVGFGIVWFFLALSIESTVIPIPMLINEYRLYMPSAFFFGAVATATGLLVKRKPHLSPSVLTALFLLLPALAGAATYNRNSLWANHVTLWKDAVSKSPNKAVCHAHLAMAYMDEQCYDKAEAEYFTALALDPMDAWSRNNLGTALFKDGRIDEAIDQYRDAAILDANFFEPRFNLGTAYMVKGRHDSSGRAFEEALRLQPWNPQAEFETAKAYWRTGKFKEACDAMGQTLRLEPRFNEARELQARLCARR